MNTSRQDPAPPQSHLHLLRGTLRMGAQALPAAITRAASQHTYQIIGSLVDRSRTQDAYRAYAYFRWVDDRIDQTLGEPAERLAFVTRQQAIVERAYAGEPPAHVTNEEQMAVDLIATDPQHDTGLHLYFQHMMAVMAFDAERRGRLIFARELDAYTHHLAVGVTEALHYFIGHDDPAPRVEARYLAVTAAHITHMLRDTCEDLAAGFYNIPLEFLTAHSIDAQDVQSDAYRAWVESRVRLAREYFKAGREYLAQVGNTRCRIAGHAYSVQFERVLDALEKDAYRLRFSDRGERI